MVRQVLFDVLLGEEQIITGLLYEKQAEPSIKEWLKAQGKAGLQLSAWFKVDDLGPDARAVYATTEHTFKVMER